MWWWFARQHAVHQPPPGLPGWQVWQRNSFDERRGQVPGCVIALGGVVVYTVGPHPRRGVRLESTCVMSYMTDLKVLLGCCIHGTLHA
jgi:hypothetical protein